MTSRNQLKKYKYVHGVECPDCKNRIWSMYRHDFRYCGCGSTYVDGGRDYLRYGGGSVQPRIVRIRVYQD